MPKKLFATSLMVVVVVTVPVNAFADPNAIASCNGTFSVQDAQNRLRDDVSHILKELAGDFGVTPGAFHQFDPRHTCI